MAAGTGPTNTDTVYQTKSLSKWFAIGSILLLIAVVWASIQDYARPWKTYQRQYKALAEASARHQMDRVNKMMNQAKLKSLNDQIADLSKKMGLPTLTEEIDAGIEKRSGEYYKVNSDYQLAKANLDALHYKVERAIMEDPKEAVKLKAELDEKTPQVEKLAQAEEKARLDLNELKDRKAALLSKKAELTDQLSKLTKTRDLLQKSIEENEQSLGNIVRNAPIVDFIAPTVKINQVILDGLYDDYFFNKVARVDRCMTCHVTIDQPGFEKYPQPFKTHPKLDLMVGPDSAHPVEKVGCTVCHSGVPQSADFINAAHAPKDPIQAAEWKEQYGFYYNHNIKTHMVPLTMVEGKCIQCHAQEVYLRDAPTYNAGMRLIEQYGCYTCHKFAGHFEKLAKERKPGPPLYRVAGKLTPEFVSKWIWNPKSFRPSATMPNFWKTHNNSDPDSLVRGRVEVDAIVHYLFENSENFEPINPPGVTVKGTDPEAKAKRASAAMGDIAKGKKLFGEVGCLACHANDDFQRNNVAEGEPGYKDPRVPMFGPEMNQLGSKVTADWVYSWLINPKHYSEKSNMPSMKLQPQEAKDLTAYLLSKRNEHFDSIKLAEPNEEVRNNVTFEFLKGEKSTQEALDALKKMSVADKQSYLGKKLIGHYGCYGCHAIKGFEDAPNIGTELSFHGSKDVSKFAFENVEIPHISREWWIFTKVRTPRIWDVGKIRDFQAKARMPHFGFSPEQAQAITAIVIGNESKNVDDSKIRPVNGRLEKIIAGHRVLHRYNCIGCHISEKRGGTVLSYYQDPSEGPPNLNTEGRKVQPKWLFSFLKNTNVMIRPWVKIRMPQFNMSDADARTLVNYFAALDNADFPFVSSQANPLTHEEIVQVEKIIQAQGCLTCHGVRKPGEDVSSAAPHFANIKVRLNGAWVPEWIADPAKIMPGTRMPQLWPPMDPDHPEAGVLAVKGYFNDDAKLQIQKVRDYLFQYPGEVDYPPPPVDLTSPTVLAQEEGKAAPAVPTKPAAKQKKAKARAR